MRSLCVSFRPVAILSVNVYGMLNSNISPHTLCRPLPYAIGLHCIINAALCLLFVYTEKSRDMEDELNELTKHIAELQEFLDLKIAE